MITTQAAANLIRDGKTYQLASLLQTGRALGMQTMNDHLLQLVRSGLVEPQEAYMKSNEKTTFKDALQKAGFQFSI
jgi:twitching motility protein PilT